MTRWHLIYLLIRDPDRVSRRLVRLLDRWPTETRRHRIAQAGEIERPGRRTAARRKTATS